MFIEKIKKRYEAKTGSELGHAVTVSESRKTEAGSASGNTETGSDPDKTKLACQAGEILLPAPTSDGQL
jgi:hypothetical protein